MDQFMDRAAGVEALQDAYEALGRAAVGLKEQEESSLGLRQNLGGPTSQIIGGMMDTVSGLRDVLGEGVTADPTFEYPDDLGGEDNSHDGAGVI